MRARVRVRVRAREGAHLGVLVPGACAVHRLAVRPLDRLFGGGG